MKNFIKVIDAYDIEKVINIDFIQSLYKDEDYTIIRFSKDDCIYVKDSYEEDRTRLRIILFLVLLRKDGFFLFIW